MKLLFSQWLIETENKINGPQDLPDIPPNCVRLTNFTNPTVGPKLISGQPFLYGRGMITSTTDSFSTNEEIWNMLISGKIDNFDRNSFGNHVILLDMNYAEHRQHSNPSIANGQVDNSRVLGVFDRISQTLQQNPNYNPNKPVASLQPLSPRKPIQNKSISVSSTQPTGTEAPVDDVW